MIFVLQNKIALCEDHLYILGEAAVKNSFKTYHSTHMFSHKYHKNSPVGQKKIGDSTENEHKKNYTNAFPKMICCFSQIIIIPNVNTHVFHILTVFFKNQLVTTPLLCSLHTYISKLWRVLEGNYTILLQKLCPEKSSKTKYESWIE